MQNAFNVLRSLCWSNEVDCVCLLALICAHARFAFPHPIKQTKYNNKPIIKRLIRVYQFMENRERENQRHTMCGVAIRLNGIITMNKYRNILGFVRRKQIMNE